MTATEATKTVADGRGQRWNKSKGVSALEDPQTHTDFSYNLDACIVQGSRSDRDETPSGQAVVERVWITSRPPALGHGVQPTVTARRAYVMLSHVQGQMIDAGELVCKRVCDVTGGGGRPNDAVNTAAAKNPNRQAVVCAARGGKCDG